ncbi:MAG: hypothetical protein ACXADB_07880 [Candidatus Hermodarchaeia archaeon]|jgi:hypothetical protein
MTMYFGVFKRWWLWAYGLHCNPPLGLKWIFRVGTTDDMLLGGEWNLQSRKDHSETMISLDVWPSSLPRIKFVFLMDFSPPRDPVVHSMQLKLYIPITDALWFRVWQPVMRGCGCDYYPDTERPEYFFEQGYDVFGEVDWDVKPSFYDYDSTEGF